LTKRACGARNGQKNGPEGAGFGIFDELLERRGVLDGFREAGLEFALREGRAGRREPAPRKLWLVAMWLFRLERYGLKD